MLAGAAVACVVSTRISVIGAGRRTDIGGEAKPAGALLIGRTGLRAARRQDATAAPIALVRQGVAWTDCTLCALRLF